MSVECSVAWQQVGGLTVLNKSWGLPAGLFLGTSHPSAWQSVLGRASMNRVLIIRRCIPFCLESSRAS